MAEYKLGFYGEEIDLKLQEIETLKNQIIALQGNIEQLIANNETITDAIAALLNAGSGAVKHIQRGVINPTVNGEMDIELSGFTNADKMVVLLDGSSAAYSSSGNDYFPYVISVTTDNLRIYGTVNTYYKVNFAYQVIEFY